MGTLRELESVLHVTYTGEIYCDKDKLMFSHRYNALEIQFALNIRCREQHKRGGNGQGYSDT